MSRHNTRKIEQKALDDLWEHWRHKVVDYLLLKKKYPKNIIILQYEDLVNDTSKTIEKISKKLKIKFNKKMLIPTIFGSKTKGNSTYGKTNKNLGKVYKTSTKYDFPKNILPKEYYQILKIVKKNSI